MHIKKWYFKSHINFTSIFPPCTYILPVNSISLSLLCGLLKLFKFGITSPRLTLCSQPPDKPRLVQNARKLDLKYATLALTILVGFPLEKKYFLDQARKWIESLVDSLLSGLYKRALIAAHQCLLQPRHNPRATNHELNYIPPRGLRPWHI